MKVALVHDYLREYGGAERVVEDLHEIFPEAPVYTFYYDPKGLGIHDERIKKWDIRTSFYQKFPFAKQFLSASRIIGPMAFESFDLSEYDLVISSSNHHSSKAVITKPETLHISYIHTPPKMLYGYTTSYNYKKHWYIRIGAELINHFLRIMDFETAQRPDILVANSKNIQNRIKKFYRRDSTVIYPGVDLSQYRKVKKEEGKYFLALNRLMRGKGTEIVVAACTKLDLPLKVVGAGPELENLKKIAGKSVEFVGPVKEEDKPEIYAKAIALIVATEQEDFGMTPPEAMAAGTPVIAARSGGYLETVIEGKTGEFFDVSPDLGLSKKYVDESSVESLVKVLENFDLRKYKEEELKKQAERFSKENFRQQILRLVSKGV
jgi:glycosyltransferase involved in cell wall biosynthesis